MNRTSNAEVLETQHTMAAFYAASLRQQLQGGWLPSITPPWGAPSKKPEHLRDDGDCARLAAAEARRARKAKFRARQAGGAA